MVAVTVASFEIYGWKFTGYLYSLLVPAAVIFPKQIICVYKKLIALPNCKYPKRPLKQSWPIGLQETNNTFQESWLWANQQLVKNNKLLEAQNLIFLEVNIFLESKMFHQMMVFYMKLCMQYPGHIFLWHKLLFCHLPAISKRKSKI